MLLASREAPSACSEPRAITKCQMPVVRLFCCVRTELQLQLQPLHDAHVSCAACPVCMLAWHLWHCAELISACTVPCSGCMDLPCASPGCPGDWAGSRGCRLSGSESAEPPWCLSLGVRSTRVCRNSVQNHSVAEAGGTPGCCRSPPACARALGGPWKPLLLGGGSQHQHTNTPGADPMIWGTPYPARCHPHGPAGGGELPRARC